MIANLNIIAHAVRISLAQMEYQCNEIQGFDPQEDSSLRNVRLFCAMQ